MADAQPTILDLRFRSLKYWHLMGPWVEGRLLPSGVNFLWILGEQQDIVFIGCLVSQRTVYEPGDLPQR
jgi:hypothetical protein